MASGTITKVLKLKDEASPALKKVERSAGTAAGKVDKLGTEAKQTGDQLKGMGDKAKTTGDKTKRAGDDAKATGSDLKGLAVKAAGAGVAILGAAKALVALNQRLADSRNDLLDTAVRTGLAAETIGGLRLAAKGSGQELGNLASGLTQFPKRMADASRGTGEAMIAFEALGIQVNDTSGNMRTADEVLRETLEGISRVPDATQRSALATQAFGKAGTSLMVALAGGDLENFIRLSREFGVSVGPQAADAASKWQREMALFDTTMEGAEESIAEALGGEQGMAGMVTSATEAVLFLSSVWSDVIGNMRTVGVSGMSAMRLEFDALKSVLSLDIPGALDQMRDAFRAAFESISALVRVVLVSDIRGMLRRAAAAVADFRAKTTGEGGGGGALNGGAPFDPDKADRISAPFDMMAGVDIGGGSGGGGRGKKPKPAAGRSELDKLSAQVERFSAKAFPISRMEAANRLLDELHAAQDRAGGVQAAAFDELITQAEAARSALGAAGLASDMEALGLSLDAIGESMDGLGELAQAAADGFNTWGTELEQLRRLSEGLQIGTAAATDVGGVVSTLGPAGGALGALSALGQQADDEDGLEAMVEANVEGFIKGFEVLITQLPGVISNTIPRILGEMIPDLIVSLVENAPAIAKAFLIDLPIALSEAFGKAFARIWDAIKDFFSKLLGFEEFSDKTKDTFHALTLGLFEGKQTGGMIDRTGLFMLHQNERVIPSSGAAPQGARGMMAGGGGGVNITINTNVVDPNSIDQLGRMLQRHFGSMGRSTLPIFGGG